MLLSLEKPEHQYFFRAASGSSCLLDTQELNQSFVLTPNALHENWAPTSVAELSVADLDVALDFDPEMIILGTGDQQIFPPAELMAYCLTRHVGLEVMNNASAARTFNILADEGRKVVAAMMLSANS